MRKCKDECPKGKYIGCCYDCPDNQSCIDGCTYEPESCGNCEEADGNMVAFENAHMAIMKNIANIVEQKKLLEVAEKKLKDELKNAMEKYSIKSIDNDFLKITYIAATVTSTVDTAKLKKKYPNIASECMKDSPKSAYIKVEVKERKGETNA